MQPAPSTPLMIDAQPVLRPDGTVRLVYTEAQKLQRNEAFLRALAIIMIGNFYRSMIYLRFHGKAEVAA